MNRRQYHRELKKLLLTIDEFNKPLLFLHICCAPCASAAIYKLKKYFKIIGIYSNSNIDTIEEFNKRKNEVEHLKQIFNSPNELIIAPYNHNEYLFYIRGCEQDIEGGNRCKHCISLRLQDSIRIATKCIEDEDIREMILGSKDKSIIPRDIYFTSTLTTSPKKDAVLINDLIEKFLIGTNMKNLPSDFKKDDGSLISIQISEKYNLYRQKYCGCEFSKN